MVKVQEIQSAIESLPQAEYVRLRQWFSERDWGQWDKQIEADSEAGKLDFLIKEAFPREFVTWLGTPTQAAETVREYILLGLYLEGRISGGKAAELLGLSRRDFVSLLARKGIDYFRLTPDEWAEEVALVNVWSEQRG